MIEMNYIYVGILIASILGISFWFFYISRVQLNVGNKLTWYITRHKIEASYELEQKSKIQENLIQSAIDKLKSDETQKKILGLMQIKELSKDVNLDMKRFIIKNLIKNVADEESETMRFAILDEICKLNKEIKIELKYLQGKE